MVDIISENIVITIISSVGMYVVDFIISLICKPLYNIVPFNVGGMVISTLDYQGILMSMISSIITICITIFISIRYINGKDIK